MRPRGPQDEAKMTSRRAPWRRLDGLGPLGSSPGVLLGGLGRLLARSGRLLEPSWELLGHAWGLPGRAWGSFGPPGGSFWSFLGLCGRLPCEIVRTVKIDDSTTLLKVFRGPGGPRIA